MGGRAARPRTARDRAAFPPRADPHARIHICPVGFEVERVTEPVLSERADRVYLLTRRDDDDAAPFVEEVVRRIERAPRPIEVEVRRADIWDVFGALRAFRAIFEEEGRGDRRSTEVVPLRVNVSTGTKITAIAGTLACMLWKGEPYYAQVTRSWYSGMTPKVRSVNDVVARIDPVSVYELRAPAADLVEVLEALDRKGGELRKRELLHELGLDRSGGGPTLSPQAQHSRLRRRLDPLESKWGFVRPGAGGGRVRITPQGRLALALFGRPEGAPGAPPPSRG
ncbi:MAG: HFX_2341 family transcriptional regulator domain-containing protein, partial [Thermoplasmata archaeon]